MEQSLFFDGVCLFDIQTRGAESVTPDDSAGTESIALFSYLCW